MPLETQVTQALYLVVAAILSALIGLDRERKANSAAGLRTHMLVGVGACLFTQLSVHAFPHPQGDPARVAAQIVSGIGFLGAGVILQREHRIVRNLTTAASIWVTASIGMAVGAGAWFLALFGTLIIWFILVILRRMEIYQGMKRRATEREFHESGGSDS
jgi:putative Mg2+ transporter-C (MgtC) family protein